jgi:hypothetical protein
MIDDIAVDYNLRREGYSGMTDPRISGTIGPGGVCSDGTIATLITSDTITNQFLRVLRNNLNFDKGD